MSPKTPPLQFSRPRPVVAAVPEAEARRIEERTEARGNTVAGQPIEQLATKQKAAPKPSKLRRSEGGVRVAGYLPAAFELELRMLCARENRSTSDALTEAVRLLLEQHITTVTK